MPTMLETLTYLAALLAGPPLLHQFAVWYSRRFRWIVSSLVIKATLMMYWAPPL